MVGCLYLVIAFAIYSIGKGWLNVKIFGNNWIDWSCDFIGFLGTDINRILGDDAASAASRIPQYKIAWRIIRDHPIFGVGANNYYFFQQRYLAANPIHLYFDGQYIISIYWFGQRPVFLA